MSTTATKYSKTIINYSIQPIIHKKINELETLKCLIKKKRNDCIDKQSKNQSPEVNAVREKRHQYLIKIINKITFLREFLHNIAGGLLCELRSLEIIEDDKKVLENDRSIPIEKQNEEKDEYTREIKEKVLECMDEDILHLQLELENPCRQDVILDYEYRYIKSYEECRFEQCNNLQNKIKEDLENQILKIKQEITEEQFCWKGKYNEHNMFLNELQVQIEKWEQKFLDDIDQFTLEKKQKTFEITTNKGEIERYKQKIIYMKEKIDIANTEFNLVQKQGVITQEEIDAYNSKRKKKKKGIKGKGIKSKSIKGKK